MTESKEATLNIQIGPDKATMAVTVLPPNGQSSGVVFTAEQLDRLMAGLADIRSKMTPPVPEEFPLGKPTHRHRATKYLFGLDPFSQEFLLSFRSPGFGWMTFPIALAAIERMWGQSQELKTRPATPHSDTKQ
jgi:hypothetical protein